MSHGCQTYILLSLYNCRVRLHHFPISFCCRYGCAAQSPGQFWWNLPHYEIKIIQDDTKKQHNNQHQQCAFVWFSVWWWIFRASQWIHTYTWVGVYYIHMIFWFFFIFSRRWVIKSTITKSYTHEPLIRNLMFQYNNNIKCYRTTILKFV